MSRSCTYVGPDEALKGKRALVRPNEGGSEDLVLLQFNDVGTGLGYGWHLFAKSMIRCDPSPFDKQDAHDE